MLNKLIPFWTLIRLEIFRFLRLIKQTVFPPIITTILFILIFGYSLGSRIQEISGLPYIVFIVPGLIAMSVVNNSFINCITAIYSSRFDRSIDNVLSSPLKPVEIVLAVVIGGIVRSFVIAVLIYGVAFLALGIRIDHLGLALLFFLGSSTLFCSFGIVSGLRAESWDTLHTEETFIITPLVYLGGVFYSIHLLPPFWQKISLFNPLFYLVDGFRYAMTGVSDISWQHSLAVTWGLALLFFAMCIYLFKVGYKLVK